MLVQIGLEGLDPFLVLGSTSKESICHLTDLGRQYVILVRLLGPDLAYGIEPSGQKMEYEGFQYPTSTIGVERTPAGLARIMPGRA